MATLLLQPRSHQDGPSGQELQTVNLVPLVLLTGAIAKQVPPHLLHPVRTHELTPRILGPLSNVNTTTPHQPRCHLQSKNFSWLADPAGISPCSLPMKQLGRHCVSSTRMRLTSSKYLQVASGLLSLQMGCPPDIATALTAGTDGPQDGVQWGLVH